MVYSEKDEAVSRLHTDGAPYPLYHMLYIQLQGAELGVLVDYKYSSHCHNDGIKRVSMYEDRNERDTIGHI